MSPPILFNNLVIFGNNTNNPSTSLVVKRKSRNENEHNEHHEPGRKTKPGKRRTTTFVFTTKPEPQTGSVGQRVHANQSGSCIPWRNAPGVVAYRFAMEITFTRSLPFSVLSLCNTILVWYCIEWEPKHTVRSTIICILKYHN